MENVGLGRYAAIFAAALIGIIAATLAVIALTGYEPQGSVGMIQTLFASFLTGMLFVRNHSRLPTRAERRILIWWSFGITVLVPTIPIAGFLASLAFRFGLADLRQGLSEFLPNLPAVAWVLIVGFTLGVTYLTLMLGYGFFTTRFGQKVLKSRGL